MTSYDPSADAKTVRAVIPDTGHGGYLALQYEALAALVRLAEAAGRADGFDRARESARDAQYAAEARVTELEAEIAPLRDEHNILVERQGYRDTVDAAARATELERERDEKALLHRQEQARAADRLKDALAANAELRDILAGMLHDADRGDRPGEGLRDLARAALSAADPEGDTT